MRLLAIGLLAIAACSHPSRSPRHGSGSGSGSGSGDPAPDAGTEVAVVADAGPPLPLTDDECDSLIDHVLEVGMVKQRNTKKSDLVPTADQVAQIRIKLAAELMDQCLDAPRSIYDCWMAATEEPALYACVPPSPARP